MLRRALPVLLLALLLPAAPAAADGIGKAGGVITADVRSQATALQVAPDGANIVFGTGFGAAVPAGAGCSAIAGGVSCPAAGTTRIDVLGSALGDQLFVGGIAVRLVWQAGRGDDGSNILGSDATGRMELFGGRGRRLPPRRRGQ